MSSSGKPPPQSQLEDADVLAEKSRADGLAPKNQIVCVSNIHKAGLSFLGGAKENRQGQSLLYIVCLFFCCFYVFLQELFN